MREPPFLSLRCLERWLPEAAARGVSEVARSERGFVAAYRAVRGDPRRLPTEWRRKRAAFLARHEAQRRAGREPLYGADGRPTRRHLALIMWAWSPDARRVCR